MCFSCAVLANLRHRHPFISSVLHIPIVHAHYVSKQIPREKNFPSG